MSQLPEFNKPPIIEVVFGIQFEPIPLEAPKVGAFWQRIRKDYPKTQTAPLLPAVKEMFGGHGAQQEISFFQTSIQRTFFLDETEAWLVQLQPDRFLTNWRRLDPTADYPRYASVKAKFEDSVSRFLHFCSEEALGNPRVNQLELTYINHIALDAGELDLASVGKIFRDLQWGKPRDVLPEPESLAWKVTFPIHEITSRLHVSLNHAIRRLDEKPLFILELTVRGMPAADSAPPWNEWFNASHERIVRAFADLTTDFAHQNLWSRIR